jgi:hypothetical protein
MDACSWPSRRWSTERTEKSSADRSVALPSRLPDGLDSGTPASDVDGGRAGSRSPAIPPWDRGFGSSGTHGLDGPSWTCDVDDPLGTRGVGGPSGALAPRTRVSVQRSESESGGGRSSRVYGARVEAGVSPEGYGARGEAGAPPAAYGARGEAGAPPAAYGVRVEAGTSPEGYGARVEAGTPPLGGSRTEAGPAVGGGGSGVWWSRTDGGGPTSAVETIVLADSIDAFGGDS